MFTFKASPIYCSSKEDKLIITTDGLAVVQLFSLFFHRLYVEEDSKEHNSTWADTKLAQGWTKVLLEYT